MNKESLVRLLMPLAVLFGVACSPAMAVPTLDENSDLARELNLPLYKWEDKSVAHRGNVVGIHGLTFYAKSYDDYARFMASQGYTFYAMDMRGFGKWKTQYKKYGGDPHVHFDATQDDLVKLLSSLREEDADKKTVVVGESLGANVGLSLAANHSDLLDGLILSSPSYKMRIHPRVRLLMDVPRSLVMLNKSIDWTPYIKPVLTEDPKVLNRLMSDESLRREFSPIELMKGLLENRKGLKQAMNVDPDFPLLFVCGEKDGMFKTAAIPSLVSKIKNRNSEVWRLQSRGHLLLEHQPVSKHMAGIMTNWMARTTATDDSTATVASAAEVDDDVVAAGAANRPAANSRAANLAQPTRTIVRSAVIHKDASVKPSEVGGKDGAQVTTSGPARQGGISVSPASFGAPRKSSLRVMKTIAAARKPITHIGNVNTVLMSKAGISTGGQLVSRKPD